MVHAVNHLLNSELIVESDESWKLGVDIEAVEVGVPDSIKQLIENQLDHLDAEQQRILHAASVAGTEFSTLAIAAGSGEDRAVIERGCSELARRHQFLKENGLQLLPNGEAVGRYGFIHAIYQNMLYERVPASRRMQMHRRIAELGEAVYGEQSREIAAKLALHFERGRDYKRAAKYLEQAAENSIRRFAYREAVSLARRGLESLSKLPDSAERAEQELSLHLTLGVPLIATEGYAASDVGSVYVRARELCQQLGSLTDVSEVLWGLRTYHTLRAEFATAHEIAEEFLRAAGRFGDRELTMRGHWALETIFLHQGKFTLALEHYDQALAFYDPTRHRDDAFTYAQNPGVAMRCFAAWALWFVGLPDQALARIQEAVVLARESSDPHGLAQALFFAAIVHQLRQEEEKAQENAEAAIAVCRERGLVLYQAMATTSRGWALVLQDRQDEGFEQLGEGLTNHRLTGAEVILPHFLGLLVEAFGKTNQVDEGLRILEEALEVVQRNGEAYYQAELYRLKGELLLAQMAAGVSEVTTSGKAKIKTKPTGAVRAEKCFQRSIKIAREQKAKSWELRSAISLARLYQNQNKHEEAHNALAEIYNSFTEGFDTIDLREAKALLNELQANNQQQPQKRTSKHKRTSKEKRTGKEGRFTPAGA
jgi:tetratricopeptide (TPR) repeat protein